jgi:hypothetical protein
MRFAVAFIGLVAAATMCRSNLVPIERKAAPNYFPLKAGSEWHYSGESNGQKVQATNRIAKVEVIDGTPLARLETTIGGQVMASEHLSSTDKGIFRHRFNGIEITPPVCLLRYPIKIGDKWESEPKVGEQKVKMKCQIGEEEVEVPAGKYKAVTLDLEADVNGIKITTRYWFVEGMGFVKQTADFGGNKVLLQLEKFVPGM